MRTAQVYMRIAKNRGEIERMLKSAEPAHLSIYGVDKALASPKDTERPIGYEWELAYRAWREALETEEEEDRLAELRRLDIHVRPFDLLPSRLRSGFKDELTEVEMHTTFETLIKTGAIFDYDRDKDITLWRRGVVETAMNELPEKEAHSFIDHLQRTFETEGTVRPTEVERITKTLEDHERKAEEALSKVRKSCFEAAESLPTIYRGGAYRHLGYKDFRAFLKGGRTGQWVAGRADELVDADGEPYGVFQMAEILFESAPNGMVAEMLAEQ